jgi:predicted GIY-YIG superfamily endonuclease
MKHTLYRFYDQDDNLLYVGISADLARRLDQHARAKPWWTDVALVRVQHHPDRATVAAAERHAIRTEQPRYNVQHAIPQSLPACLGCRDEQRETLTERERREVERVLAIPGHVGPVLTLPLAPHTCTVTAVTDVPVTTSAHSATNSDRSDRRVTAESAPQSLPHMTSDLQRRGRSDQQ